MFEDSPITPEQREAELKDPRLELLLAQLRDDIRTEVAQHLPKFRDRESEFAQVDTGDLLAIYLNWKHRQIHPHPRKIVYSAELAQRIRTGDVLYAPVKSEFDELARMITDGEDLLSLLSPRVVSNPYQLEPNHLRLNREKHLDLLLNEQGVHHLHLPGLARKKDAPIVFAVFEPDYAFLLDLARHDDYQTDRLARISYGNWPERHFVRIPMDRLVDEKGNEIDLKDQHRVLLRNAAINAPIKIADGLYVMSKAVGVAANGFGHVAAGLAQSIWNSLTLFAIRRDRPRFDEYFRETTGKPLPANPVFHFRFGDSGKDWTYVIVEEETGGIFSLPNGFCVTRGLRVIRGSSTAQKHK